MVIVEVAPNSPAAERELRPGDVIVEVQQERVATPAEVQERIARLRQQNRAVALFAVEGAGGPALRAAAPARGAGRSWLRKPGEDTSPDSCPSTLLRNAEGTPSPTVFRPLETDLRCQFPSARKRRGFGGVRSPDLPP